MVGRGVVLGRWGGGKRNVGEREDAVGSCRGGYGYDAVVAVSEDVASVRWLSWRGW